MLRRLLVLLGVMGMLTAGLPSGGAQEEEKGPAYPAVGSLIPGPLVEVLNVTGERKGRYHCLVVRNGLHPVAAIFANLRSGGQSIEDALKMLDPDTPLVKLFKQLDEMVDENIDTFSAAYAVFQVEKDDKKAEEFQMIRKLVELEKELPLKRLVFGVTEVHAKHRPEDADVFVVIYHYHKVVATRSFNRERPLTDKDVAEIVALFKQSIPKLPKRTIKVLD